MNHRFDELAEALAQASRRHELRKFGIWLWGLAVVCGVGITAWAGWTPPESSVTPPAVVTLDAFAALEATGANPAAPLVVGADGALYGSTQNGGADDAGTLFRAETNGTFTKLHDFHDVDGANPTAALVVGPDGALYGSTQSGGSSEGGTLFRLGTNGTFTKLHDFNGTNGAYPRAALVVGPDGALYGSTFYRSTNGSYDGDGTLFRMETNGKFTELHDFSYTNDGANPYAALVVGPDGALYGSTENGGSNFDGTVFRIETNGTFRQLHAFSYNDGGGLTAPLVVGPDSALYGSAQGGGTQGGYGTVFRVETNGAFRKLHDFAGADGNFPYAALVVGPDNALYGSTLSGGSSDYGTLFRLGTNGTFTEIHDFNYTNDGAYPFSALVVGPDGALYGSTQRGGSFGNSLFNYGTLFRVETNGAFTKLHDFHGTDGFGSMSAAVVGPDGGVYGSTPSGGAADYGTLFRVETTGAFTELHDFVATDGYFPLAALVAGPDGALYGSTQLGGSQGNYGTLFRVETDATFTKMHDFNGTNDGSSPSVAMVVGSDGALYGSTQNGGTNGNGTLFRVETNGTFTKLHDFNYPGGSGPSTPLVLGPDGAMYGTTVYGGTGIGYYGGDGILFRVETNGTFTKLYEFNGPDGSNPSGGLAVGSDAALYGTTWYGGTNGYGTLFRLQTNGDFAKLHDFDGTDGYVPSATLVVGLDGAFYGFTEGGGANGAGTLFRVETNGTFTKLHDFNGTDGSGATLGLVAGRDGMVYGVSGGGGTNGAGTLFRIETDGTITRLHDFNGTDGYGPNAGLVVGPDGAVYGSTQNGGTNFRGTLFRLQTNGSFTNLYDFHFTDGGNPRSAAMAPGPDGALYGTTPYGGPRQGGIIFKLVLNRPPVARCHDVTVSAGANCGADASVDNGSFDPDSGDTTALRQEPPGPYPLGVTPVTLTVTDNHGESNSCTATVTVMDTTPPTISDVAVTPNILWPPNNKMVEVTVNYTAADDCGDVTNVLVVTSNEATSGPAPDWVIEDEHHVQLRAERSGSGSGRVYRVTAISTDNAGNSSIKAAMVKVPKSQGK